MCTMTWFTTDDGYELFFNRDESLSRKKALPPVCRDSQGLTYVSPTDADAGGTWIASNHHGITVCLLNHYQFQQIITYKNWVSRGNIVREFAEFSDLSLAEQRFSSMNLEDYRAFRMFLIQPDGQNRLFVWDGHTGRIEYDVPTPRTSSSVDAKEVKAIRKGLFANLGLQESKDRQAFIDFHSSHIPYPSRESVCMHREDAKTVSFSHVIVTADAISFAYADGSPCETALGEPLIMQYVKPATTSVKPIRIASSNAN